MSTWLENCDTPGPVRDSGREAGVVMSGGTEHHRGPFEWAKEMEYSQAVVSNGLIFVSGQFGADANGDVVSDDFAEQAQATFVNLRRVLELAGGTLDSVLHLRVFLLRSQDYPAFKDVRRHFLPGPSYPGSTIVQTGGFVFPGMLVELEAVARVVA